ncbi:RND transporter [Bremerella cremea]|uniref:RND transporter n=1 Tax=Bremerella cremea TaxID=1031537 RepID=A0A368KLF0_9BACT|nr:RND transporter [Bremerella cremea]RCS42038.1 RND transporter [Bremerella cremea]
MKWMFSTSSLAVGLLAVAALSFAGCSGGQSAMGDADEHSEVAHDDHDHGDEHSHVHGEWWCGEHGVPEEICALCDTKLIVEFKEKGDWCEEHNRPASQCFICSPELFDKFAARYKAKYGEDPPKPEALEKGADS